jgi:type I restriction enzyme S subunit
VPQLTAPQISKYEIPIPACAEQVAITTIFSDMDSELMTLESRRDKARQLKQGMMQELLTGRIRLSQSSQEAKLC